MKTRKQINHMREINRLDMNTYTFKSNIKQILTNTGHMNGNNHTSKTKASPTNLN